jgi:hypothetical protein
MEDFEIRAKAAEIALNFSAHATGGMITHGGLASVTEIAPFAIVKDVEDYIRYGIIPEPIPVTKTKIS